MAYMALRERHVWRLLYSEHVIEAVLMAQLCYAEMQENIW